MIERHTFKALLTSIVEIEIGITALEKTLNCHFDQNWMTDAPSGIIRAIAEGFFDKIDINSLEEDQADTIEELLYHFIYMEDCGNDSEHCKVNLVKISNNSGEEKSLSCTNLDELYGVICTYLARDDLNFHFNYCHSYKQDDAIQEVV